MFFKLNPEPCRIIFKGQMQVERFLRDFLHFDGMENKTIYFDVNHLV